MYVYGSEESEDAEALNKKVEKIEHTGPRTTIDMTDAHQHAQLTVTPWNASS